MLRVPTAVVLLLLPAATFATPLAGQHEHGHDHASPYVDLLTREIKALSPEEVEGLRAGMGLEQALPAELNGYPGPRHVLDMAPLLELTGEQRDRVQEVFDAMDREARALGEEIVEGERALDRAFAEGTIDAAELDRLVTRVGSARARLRIVHLRAHLELVPVLTDEQRARYAGARGYAQEGGGAP